MSTQVVAMDLGFWGFLGLVGYYEKFIQFTVSDANDWTIKEKNKT